MEIISKTLRLPRDAYYKRHLQIINHILPISMTDKEVEILGLFIAFQGDIAVEPFGATGRKIVMQKAGLSAGGLTNYLRQLKKKGFIKEIDGKLTVLPMLFPAKDIQGYQFKLVNDGQ